MKRTALFLALALCAAAARAAGPAPDFTLKTVAGPNLRLAEQRGQVVMVNFWASWCAPCKQEMPHLNQLYDKYRNTGFVLLGVNVDDDPAKAAAEAAKLGIRFPVLLDSAKAVSKAYALGAMPTTVVIDRDGQVRHVHQGYRTGVEQVYDQQVRALVRE
jgi:peroxiredoxin